MDANVINLQYSTVKEPLPKFIYDGLEGFVTTANIYHPQPVELIEKIAKKHNISKETIYLTAGIDEAIQMLALAFGKNTYIFTPTYIVYKDVEEFGWKLNKINVLEGIKYEITSDSIKDATLIYLANPNNPSGFTKKEKVMELVKNNQHCVVVIDEAYAEFSNLSVINEVKDNSNMVVFRSFSKDYAMAGSRIGYIVASQEIINKVKNKAQWANISYLSVGAAIVSMDHEEYFKKIREDINQRRDDFLKFLNDNKYPVLPSNINAVLLKFNTLIEGTNLVNYLLKNNIIVSHGNGNSNIGLDESCVRIAIGSEEQMKIVKEVIARYKTS